MAVFPLSQKSTGVGETCGRFVSFSRAHLMGRALCASVYGDGRLAGQDAEHEAFLKIEFDRFR